MSKEMWIAQYDRLLNEYEENHPECSPQEAEAYAEKKIDARYRDAFADLIDGAKLHAKAEGNWPPKVRP